MCMPANVCVHMMQEADGVHDWQMDGEKERNEDGNK